MKTLKPVVVGIGLLALIGCNTIKKEYVSDGFRVEKDSLNTTITFSHDRYFNKDSLSVLRHFYGNSYYFEDYDCDGSVDMIHFSNLNKFIYKKDPVTKEKIEGYELVFDKANALLNKYRLELKIDDYKIEYHASEEEKSFLEYLGE